MTQFRTDEICSKKVWEVLYDSFEKGLLERDHYEDQKKKFLNKYKHLNGDDGLIKFRKSYIRIAALLDFKIFLMLLNGKEVFGKGREYGIFKNPVICEHIDKIDRENNEAYRVALRNRKKVGQYDYKDDDEFMEIMGRRKPITHIRIPRGERKTSYFICARGVFIYLRDAVILNRPPAIMFGHGDRPKAIKNLAQAKRYINSDIIKYLFQDQLDPIVDSQERMSFDVVRDGTVNEDHFSITSVDSDPTGQHPTIFLLDDWVTPDNCMTIDRIEKTTNSFWRIWWLNDHSGLRRIEKAGTAYAVQSVDEHLRKLASEDGNNMVEFTDYGATYRDGQPSYDDNGDVIYWFPYNPEYNEEGLSRAKKILPHHQFMSQIQMVPYDMNQTGLVFDTPLPVWYDPYIDNKEFQQYSVILVDPAVSQRNKNSRMTILACTVSNTKKLFVHGGYSSRGTTPTHFIEKIVEMQETYGSKALIIEAVSAQEYMMMHIMERFSRDGITCQVIPHRHQVAKAVHYKSYLEPLLNQGKIFVHPSQKELIRQLNNESDLSDEVDCLSFIKELKIQWSEIVEYENQMTSIRGVEYDFNEKLQNTSRFSTIAPY